VGADRDVNALIYAKSARTYISLLLCEGEKMPFRSNSFSTVVSNSVFEHLYDPGEVLRETARIIQNQGKLIFTIPNPLTQQWWLRCNLWHRLKNTVWKHENLRFSSWWVDELTASGFGEVIIRDFQDRGVSRVLDFLFIPAAIWFLMKKLALPIPCLGRFRPARSLICRALERLYWRTEIEPGASYLIEATKV